jgi:ABC-type transport system substrate-binding protein
MRRMGVGVFLAVVAALGACRAQTDEPRQLTPLPGLTTASTVLAATTTLDPAATTTIPLEAVPTTAVAAGWPFEDFRSVLRLGGNAVTGSGCGADGSVGEVIPDGWWLGIITADGNSQMQVDLVCAYGGGDAQPLIDECLASESAATCTDFFDDTFWPVNRNTRERTVTKSSSLATEAVADLCGALPDPRPDGIAGVLNWLQIQNGEVVYIRRGCDKG